MTLWAISYYLPGPGTMSFVGENGFASPQEAQRRIAELRRESRARGYCIRAPSVFPDPNSALILEKRRRG
jgi:hypothetical protein